MAIDMACEDKRKQIVYAVSTLSNHQPKVKLNFHPLNARSSLWNQHGTNQQGRALEAAFSDVLFTPVSTASPTHPGTRQGDTDSTIDLALVSPKLVPWTRAQTLASHASDHLPVVFSVQKPGIEQRRKLQYPFQYGKSDMGVMSKLRAHTPPHTANPRQKAAIQPPWWNKETQAAWTDKRTMVKLWQKERSLFVCWLLNVQATC